MISKVYLIPTYLSEDNGPGYISDQVKDVLKTLDLFAVENLRTARRFISSLRLGITIEDLHFELLDKNFTNEQCLSLFQRWNHKELGIISESGLPGIADPGQIAVSMAHREGIPVIPLAGGSSIILGLISSGFNGQQFTFHGYLPIDKQSRKRSIVELQKNAQKSGYTQLFMETPYRNDQLFRDLLLNLDDQTLLYVGRDITGSQMNCTTMKVIDWRNSGDNSLGKVPCIFGIGSNIHFPSGIKP